MTELEIPYRVVAIAIDDLGAPAAMKYDIEAWLPGQGRYRELTSTSNTTDFQARRLDVRYRPNTNPPAVRFTSRPSTGPRSRSGGRSSRCWRMASRTTGRSGCRPRWRRSGHPRSWRPRRTCAPSARAGPAVLRRPELCPYARAAAAARPALTDRAAAARMILLPPCASPVTRGPGGRSSSSTISAARGGPHIAILARIRTPNVFHGRTKLRVTSASRPCAASAIAAANPVRLAVSASAGISSSDTGVSIASSSVTASRRCASRESAWTSRRESTTTNASRSLGTRQPRVSSIIPSPHAEHTRPEGGGGMLPGAGAAQ